ncbi:type II secretion system protein GspK [Luteibacter sp. 329MFSha]|uniref:general secretion pathway protein GspK n=1 Tax=Luteibacter sp. 329MFSha TaxID=1798239 RepID=UPI0008B5E9B3|nr:type II secretion system protein GspK [Luteibacter sp. 329MFSha]SEW20451.1 general secretion pathway protein K [Luteibacter sp. 329MFSha]
MMFGRHTRGVALLIVLWGCTLLAIMLGGFAALARTEGLQARYQFAQTRAHYAAEAGVMRAIAALQAPDASSRWIADGRVYVFAFDDAKVDITIVDEDGKVDLNAASGDVLTGLFKAAGVQDDRAGRLSSAIQDWRRPGDAASPNGAKKPQYEAAGLAYGPRNGPFASVEEARMVLGMDAATWATVAPALTIWSGRERPNTEHAQPLALAAIPGLGGAGAEAVLATRAQGGGGAMAGGNGVTHTIRAEAILDDGTRSSLTSTIRLRGIRSGNQPYAVLRWREGDTE